MKKVRTYLAVFIGVSYTLLVFGGDFIRLAQSTGIMDSMPRTDAYNEDEYVPSEFRVEDLKIGDGEMALPGDEVVILYRGWLKKNKSAILEDNFDIPLSFTLGVGLVIEGWDRGIVGMKKGGVREIEVPPEMAFGDTGYLDERGKIIVPANEPLIFEVSLVSISR